MSSPKIVGFRGATPYSWLKILDTTDVRAFDMGVVVPGTTRENYSAYWYNLGPAQLHDPQLSLVPHPVLDLGLDADTIDVMKLAASATDALDFATPAKAANTAGWAVPMTDPVMPWADVFQCGIIWSPGVFAVPGMIRKAFQWDGGYFPDTWDYMWAPLANEAMPDAGDYDYPLTIAEGVGTHAAIIESDAAALTGYRLNLFNPITAGDYITYEHPDTPGNPWYDNVDNAVGYLIKLNCRWDGAGEGYPAGVGVEDGTYQYIVRWNRDGSNIRIVCRADEGFAAEQTVTINYAYREILIEVKGTALKVYVDGTLAITAVLNLASTVKRIGFGMIQKPSSGTHWGTWLVQYFKYYTGGITEPLY